jgi:hypothetical protein
MEALRPSSEASTKGSNWRYLSPLDERRRSSRQSVRAKGLVSGPEASRFGGEIEGQLVEVDDLTLEGVGFTSPVVFTPGAVHQILVMSGPLRLSSRFRVVSCRAAGNGGAGPFEVGGEFC